MAVTALSGQRWQGNYVASSTIDNGLTDLDAGNADSFGDLSGFIIQTDSVLDGMKLDTFKVNLAQKSGNATNPDEYLVMELASHSVADGSSGVYVTKATYTSTIYISDIPVANAGRTNGIPVTFNLTSIESGKTNEMVGGTAITGDRIYIKAQNGFPTATSGAGSNLLYFDLTDLSGATDITKGFTFNNTERTYTFCAEFTQNASSNLPENTIFNETDTYSQWWLQDGKWLGRNQPNEISDLWAWWRAEEQYMSLNGSGVTTWNPQTNATAYQIKADSSSEEPTFEANGRNGRGIVKFDGSEWLHTTDDSNNITQPMTFVMVMKFPTGASKTIFDVDNTGAGGRILCRSTSVAGKFELLNGGTVNSATVSAVSEEWGYMVITLNGASSKWRINGGNEVTVDVSDNFNPITIGADYGGNNDMTGDIMHFIIYDKELSSSEITEIEAWCANEAGL